MSYFYDKNDNFLLTVGLLMDRILYRNFRSIMDLILMIFPFKMSLVEI